MLTFEIDDDEFSHFGVQLQKGSVPSHMSEFGEDDIGMSLWDTGYLLRTREGRVNRFRYLLRERWRGRLSLRFGRKLYDVPTDPDFRGNITSTRTAPPPIPWEELHAATRTYFDEATKLRIMRASVRVGHPPALGGGTVVVPPVEMRHLLKPGEMLILCSGHQIPDSERHDELVVDVPILQGLKCIGYQRLTGTFLVTSEGSGIGGQNEGDCGWLKFTPGDRTPEQIPLADTHRWYSSSQQLMQVGCPDGVLPEWRMTKAVRAERNYLGGSVNLALPSRGGHSGGGIFDADGYLVAVLVHTSTDNASYSFGHNLVDYIGKRTYQRSGLISGAWHPSTAIDVARRYFQHVPDLRKRQFIQLSKEVFSNPQLSEESRRIAEQQFHALLMTLDNGM